MYLRASERGEGATKHIIGPKFAKVTTDTAYRPSMKKFRKMMLLEDTGGFLTVSV
jgi:hypothetical protein